MAKRKDPIQAKLDKLTADLMNKITPMFTPSERRIIAGFTLTKR